MDFISDEWIWVWTDVRDTSYSLVAACLVKAIVPSGLIKDGGFPNYQTDHYLWNDSCVDVALEIRDNRSIQGWGENVNITY